MHEINFVILIQVFTITALVLISALKIDYLDVPKSVIAGESIELTCMYKLEKDTLYSIKWYKNGYEFYRFVPREYPQAQSLAMPNSGIKLDLSKSDAEKVYLQNVNLTTAGKYRCEISAEAPSFNTAAKEAFLEIQVLPAEGPRIDTGGRKRFHPGDVIAANCVSAKSKPVAKLYFSVNGKTVGADHTVEFATTLHADGLETSSINIRFFTKNDEKSNLKLECTAKIGNYSYIMSNEQLLINDINMEPEKTDEENAPIIQVTSKSEAKDIHNSDSPKDWKVLSVLFAMYIHRQLQRVFVT